MANASFSFLRNRDEPEKYPRRSSRLRTRKEKELIPKFQKSPDKKRINIYPWQRYQSLCNELWSLFKTQIEKKARSQFHSGSFFTTFQSWNKTDNYLEIWWNICHNGPTLSCCFCPFKPVVWNGRYIAETILWLQIIKSSLLPFTIANSSSRYVSTYQ